MFIWPNLDLGQKSNKHVVLQSVHLNQQSQKVSIHIEVVLLHKCKRIMPIFISITHTGCRAFTSKAMQCKNKNQFCSTSPVIPVHEALRINIQKEDVSALKNIDLQPDSGTNFHLLKWCVQGQCNNPNYAVA